MKKSYFNKRWIALLTTMTLLVSLFTFATPVFADTLNTYTENFDNYDADNATTTWTYTARSTDRRTAAFAGTATVESETSEESSTDKALKVYSGEYYMKDTTTTTTNYGAISDPLTITAPSVDPSSELVEISFTFRQEGSNQWPFSKFAHVGGYDRSGHTTKSVSGAVLSWNNTTVATLSKDTEFYFKYVYDLKNYTVDIYAGTDSLSLKGENLPWVNTTDTNYETRVQAIKDALLADNISVIFAAFNDWKEDGTKTGNGWASGSSYTYWIDDLKVVGAKAPVTGLKEYTQDFESYGDYDLITYNYTLASADNGGTATVENFDTDNKALKVVSKATSSRDKMKISLPGMPDDVDQIEIFFKFRIEGDGRREFYNFASTQDNNNHLRGHSNTTVGMYRNGSPVNGLHLGSAAGSQWLKVRQVYNLKDNTFSVYYGDNYENTWVLNDTENKTDAWVNSLTGDTINLWFGSGKIYYSTVGESLTYWLDDIKIVGSTLPDEILYNEDGTALHTGAITGGTTVTVKVSGKDEYTEYAGFAALKNKATGDLADVELYTPDNLDGITLTAPAGDETYIVEIYYFGSLNTLKPLCNKITLGDVES